MTRFAGLILLLFIAQLTSAQIRGDETVKLKEAMIENYALNKAYLYEARDYFRSIKSEDLDVSILFPSGDQFTFSTDQIHVGIISSYSLPADPLFFHIDTAIGDDVYSFIYYTGGAYGSDSLYAGLDLLGWDESQLRHLETLLDSSRVYGIRGKERFQLEAHSGMGFYLYYEMLDEPYPLDESRMLYPCTSYQLDSLDYIRLHYLTRNMMCFDEGE